MLPTSILEPSVPPSHLATARKLELRWHRGGGVVGTSSTCSLHAVLGINWDNLRDRASHNGYYLTTDFVPEVLSPVMVRVATLFHQILTTSWWLQAGVISIAVILLMVLVGAVLTCLHRRDLHQKMKQFPQLAGNLADRDMIAATAKILDKV